MSDKIVKCKEDFEWTDDMAVEYAVFRIGYNHNNPFFESDCLKKFKASKQRKCLFTTEDMIPVYYGGSYYMVDTRKNFEITFEIANKNIDTPDIYCKNFSTEIAAKEYVRLNKPSYSLNDIYNSWRKCDGGYLDLINTIEKLKQ